MGTQRQYTGTAGRTENSQVAVYSYLKRDWGWSRTLMDGEYGAATWAGWGSLRLQRQEDQ